MRAEITLLEVAGAQLEDDFFRYLAQHIQDNGSAETGYFQPLSRSASRLSEKKEAQFRASLKLPFGVSGWRKTWVARAASSEDDGAILGHVDLRARPESCAAHRCLLGMGVASSARRQGLGQRLLSHACDWAAHDAALEWLDLQVLAENQAAIALYRRAGFITTGQTADMYRIDGKSIGLINMTLALQASINPSPNQ